MDWTLRDGRYVAEANGVKLVADPSELAGGVAVFVDDTNCCNSFGLNDSSLEEKSQATYCRGRDLFTFFQGESHFVECYWRVASYSVKVVTIESIVSLRSTRLQTELLEFSQTIRPVDSSFKTCSSKPNTLSNGDQSCTFSVMVHPQDQAESEIEYDGGQVIISIRAPEMERGVIRRFRFLQAIWTESFSDSDYDSVEEWFADSAIPLTT